MSGPITATRADQERYNAILRKFASGAGMTEEDLAFHVEFQNRNVHPGLAIDDMAPDFALPDQHGRTRRLHDLIGPNGMILSFIRTTWWCPYCRNQSKELDLAKDLVGEKGITVAAITPDPVDIHRQCAEAYGLRYPLLSDEGSTVIEAYGIINHAIPEDVPSQRYRMPFPGIYLLDRDGIVRSAAFLANYEHRRSATVPVMARFGVSGGVPSTRISVEGATIDLALSTAKAFPGHELGLTCTIAPDMGYAVETAGEAVPAIALAPELLAHAPSPLPHERAVAKGTHAFDTLVPLRWSAPTEFDYIRGVEHLARERIAPGMYELRGTVSAILRAPAGEAVPVTAPFALPFQIMANVARPAGLGPSLADLSKLAQSDS